MSRISVGLTAAQEAVIADVSSSEIAAVGGVGSGKTFVLTRWAWDRAMRNPPGSVVLVVEPTWKMVKRVLVPEFRRWFELLGIPHTLNQSDFTLSFEGREIWMASGEIPENLSGQTVACVAMDEFALQDAEVYRRLTSRRRDPRAKIRQTLLVGTPEGLNWAHEIAQRMKLVRMPTRDNTFLPSDYLEQLRLTYSDPARWKMYVEGEAVQLSGGIYTNYAARHQRKCENPHAGRLCVGLDFNVGHMTSPICRIIGDEIHVVGEVTSTNTHTAEHVARVKDALCKIQPAFQLGHHVGGRGLLPHHRVTGEMVSAYMDASGAARKTSATRSDKEIVRDVGLWPECEASNPPVRERIAQVQYALASDKLFVDPAAAPITHKALTEHAYKKGSNPPEPQKTWGEGATPLDSAADALGYVVWGVLRRRPARAL